MNNIHYGIIAGVIAANGGFATKIMFQEEFYFESKIANIIASTIIGYAVVILIDLARLKFFLKALEHYPVGFATLTAFIGNIIFTVK